ncbi:MAG: hypothetical protein EOO77_03165 [Oxalobacteraceae bacterium]|nr:MAG: hypothetical protein EOO77_03165 [Oxalobacteraceae bacterium]
MFLSDLRGQQASQVLRGDAACVEHVSNPPHTGPDNQLIADCRSLMRQFSDLLNDIEQAADTESGEPCLRQVSLCAAEDQTLALMARIMVTRASTHCGVQSKHAVADFLVAAIWYDEPSPFRDKLLLSFVLDAARLQYPKVEDDYPFADEELDATTTVVVLTNTYLTLKRELAACFAQKDQNTEPVQVNESNLDNIILGLSEKNRTTIKKIIAIQSSSAAAINAKRLVLRRMLESAVGSYDAHHLRVELARSYLRDLNIFFQAYAPAHEPLSAYDMICNGLSNSFRWLTSSVHLR